GCENKSKKPYKPKIVIANRLTPTVVSVKTVSSILIATHGTIKRKESINNPILCPLFFFIFNFFNRNTFYIPCEKQDTRQHSDQPANGYPYRYIPYQCKDTNSSKSHDKYSSSQ